jgi:hypothetical protein
MMGSVFNSTGGGTDKERGSLFSRAADTWNMTTEDAMPLLQQYMACDKDLSAIEKDKGDNFNEWKKKIEKFNKDQEQVRKYRAQAWEYGASDLGLDIYGKDQAKFNKVYEAFMDMSEPDRPGGMKQKIRALREQMERTNDSVERSRLEGEIQHTEKYYADRYDKLRNKMIKPARVRRLDYANRYRERMDTLKIQETVKQIINRLDYTNANCDSRVLRAMNKDQGFIEMARKGDFHKAADEFLKIIDDAEKGVDITADEYKNKTLLGNELRGKVWQWSRDEKRYSGLLSQMKSVARNYHHFLGNPKGETRSGGWNAAKNAVAAMFQIEIIKEVSNKIDGYNKAEGQDEQAYRRNIDVAVKKVGLNKYNPNFAGFFERHFRGVKCDFEKLITRKKDGKDLNEEEDLRLQEQIKCLQTLETVWVNGAEKRDAKGDVVKLSNTDIGKLRAMADISSDIDTADEKSNHQDAASEAVRDLMKDFYIPMKKLDNFKGQGQGKG